MIKTIFSPNMFNNTGINIAIHGVATTANYSGEDDCVKQNTTDIHTYSYIHRRLYCHNTPCNIIGF